MNDSLENRRAGRERELREKMRATIDRYEDVFGKPLSAGMLHSFLEDSERANVFNFLKDRMGVLSDADITYLRRVLKESVALSAGESKVVASTDALDELPELSEGTDLVDETDLSSFSA